MKQRTCCDVSQPRRLAWRQSDTPLLLSHGSSGAWWCLLKKKGLLSQEQQAGVLAPELITDLCASIHETYHTCHLLKTGSLAAQSHYVAEDDLELLFLHPLHPSHLVDTVKGIEPRASDMLGKPSTKKALAPDPKGHLVPGECKAQRRLAPCPRP